MFKIILLTLIVLIPSLSQAHVKSRIYFSQSEALAGCSQDYNQTCTQNAPGYPPYISNYDMEDLSPYCSISKSRYYRFVHGGNYHSHGYCLTYNSCPAGYQKVSGNCVPVSSCNVGDIQQFSKISTNANGSLFLNTGSTSRFTYDDCNYECDNSITDSFVDTSGNLFMNVSCTNIGDSSDDSYPELLVPPILPPQIESEITSDSGCIIGENNLTYCQTDDQDCPTIDGINLCKTPENPSGCVEVADVKGQMVQLCSGQKKECMVNNEKLLCAVDPDSNYKKVCLSSGTTTCLTNETSAIKTTEQTDITTNADGSVTETTTYSDNVSCSATGIARNISSNPNYWTDGTLVTRDSNNRINNQYICNDEKKTTKTTNPDGSSTTQTTGRLSSEDLKRKGDGSEESSNSSNEGVEARLDTLTELLQDTGGNSQSAIDTAIASGKNVVDDLFTQSIGTVSGHLTGMENDYSSKASPSQFLPDIFPQTIGCEGSYLVNEVINVPFTGKQINFNFSPCEKFAPIRELFGWAYFVFSLFRIKNIVFSTA